MGYTAATGAAASAAAVAQAIRASGAIVSLDPDQFSHLLEKINDPLIVMAEGGVLSKHFQYLVSYKGLVFHTKSSRQLLLSPDTELVVSRKIWIPG